MMTDGRMNDEQQHPEPSIGLDDVLLSIGEFGPYQIMLFFLTAPFGFFLAFIGYSQVFITLVPDHWCHIPQLVALGLNQSQRKELSIPLIESEFIDAAVTPTFDRCLMYDIDYNDIQQLMLMKPNSSSWKTVKCQHGWDYDLKSTRYSTIVSEYDWVCDDADKVPLAQAVFFVGSIVGGIISGCIADRFGRIPAIVMCNLVSAVAGIITTFSPNFAIFAFSRFLMGIGYENGFNLVYILVLEYVGPRYRSILGKLSMAVFYTAGTVVLPWIAWGISDWRKFSLATSIPMLLASFAPLVLPESPRWLITQGKYERVFDQLRTVARMNKKSVNETMFSTFKITEEAKKTVDIISRSSSATVVDLIKNPRMRRHTILLTLLWVCIVVVYDGHTRNVTNLGSDVFVTFSVASLTELPADLIIIFPLDRWGRRACTCFSLLFSGLFSLIAVAFPDGDEIGIATGLAIMGRLCINMTYSIGLQYGAELLPTVVRAQGISCVHTAGHIASILSPYIVDLAQFNRNRLLPLIVLSILSFFGAGFSFFLPETLNATLPETIEDGENFGKDQLLSEFPCCPSSSCRRHVITTR